MKRRQMQCGRTNLFSIHMRYRYISRCGFLFIIIILSLVIVFRCKHKCKQCQRIVTKDDTVTTSYEIPNIVHFITGQGDASDKVLEKYGPRIGYRRMERAPNEFLLINYLVLLSVRKHINPDKLYVHYSFQPVGYWWLKAKQDRELNLTLNQIPPIKSIYNHPLYHHAHRTDVARLEILDKYGGIYLDLDVLVLKSFSSLTSNQENVEAIFAWEKQKFSTICNAVILAPIHSKFLQRVYQSYQSFNSSCWGCHSVLLTGELARIYRNEVSVLSSKAFFSPSWSNIDELYLYNTYNFKRNYACHLWNSYVGNIFLYNLTLASILKPVKETTFIRMIVRGVGNEKLNKIARESSL